jgi:hypothetical protein
LQGGDVFSVVVGLYDDVHVVIEGDEEAQKALHGELAEVRRAAKAGSSPGLVLTNNLKPIQKVPVC